MTFSKEKTFQCHHSHVIFFVRPQSVSQKTVHFVTLIFYKAVQHNKKKQENSRSRSRSTTTQQEQSLLFIICNHAFSYIMYANHTI